MSPSEATTPIEVERADGADVQYSWQAVDKSHWSFGSLGRRLLGPVGQSSEPHNPGSANGNGATMPGTENANGTRAGIQQVEVPDRRPVSPPVVKYGKRGFAPLQHWEGVVQRLTDDGFSARLVPFEDGRANPRRVEFTDFDFDDLSDESDLALVQPGAVFYWTIGRARNVAGAITNQSLVRLRRVPPPSPHQRQKARKEAAELMSALGGDD